MAQEDREAYIAWLRDEVGWHCNSRGCYEAFWDYDDSVTPDQMAEACANYEEAGFASPLNYLDESIMEKPGFIGALENELISAITRDAATAPEGVDEQWVESGDIWGSLFIHGYHHDGGVDVEVRQLTDAGEEALDVIEDAWYGEPFTSGGKEYDGSPESVDTAMRDLWEDPDLCPTPRYMELAFGCPAEEYEAPAIDPLLEAAEFTPSAIMSAEVAPGAVTATVHDVSGVPYEVPADVLNGLKDAVRISDRAATIEPSASLTIDGWNQKLDDSLWALDFEDRNVVPPQLSDWLARDAEGEKGNESAKTSPVSLKTAAEEAHAVSTMLSKKNGGTDEQDGKDDLQRHMIPSEMRIPSQNDHHRAPSLSDIAAETRAASAAMETNIASRIDRERDAR